MKQHFSLPLCINGKAMICTAHRQMKFDDLNSRMSTPEQNVSEFKSKSGIKRILNALVYSLDGFKTAWRTEHAFRQEVLLVSIATVIALSLPVPALQKLLLIGVLVIVLIVELINSAIEAVVDRISLERHPFSKNAKDFGSAAVLLALLLAAATWGVIVLPVLHIKFLQ
jgi:diacylglycerol kinase (ATP)